MKNQKDQKDQKDQKNKRVWIYSDSYLAPLKGTESNVPTKGTT